jgi:hypothetical protein
MSYCKIEKTVPNKVSDTNESSLFTNMDVNWIYTKHPFEESELSCKNAILQGRHYWDSLKYIY